MDDELDLSVLSNSDLKAIAGDNFAKVSDATLRYLSGEEVTAGQAFTRVAERTATGFTRGGAELLKKFGVDTSQPTPPPATEGYDDPLAWMNGTSLSAEAQRSSLATPGERQLTELERQQELKIAGEQQPVASFAGAVVGSLADPTNLIGFGAKTITKGALQLGGLGAITGAVEPVYEEFPDDTRLQNIAIGTGAGALFGGAFGYLGGRAARKLAEVEAPTTTPEVPKTREQIEAELPKIDVNENLPTLLSKAPEGDQKYVDSVLSRYDDDEPLSAPVLKDLADNVEDKNLAALFKGAADVVESTDPEKQLAKAAAKQQDDLAKATTDAPDSRALSTNSIEYAEKTGDYRDWLTTSSVRLADIRPKQFEQMVAKDNPFKTQNIKVLINNVNEYDETLEQVYGALQGRFNLERQGIKPFAKIEEQAATIPEEVVVSGYMNRKIEEVFGAEMTAAITKATAQAIQDLHSGQELARVAKELGSDEAYAVLQGMMGKASALLASVEGNSSNLGRALGYLRRQKKLIAENKQLLGYLGGFKC